MADFVEAALERVVFVVVAVGAEGEEGTRRVGDVAGLFLARGLKLAVHVDALVPAVVSADDVIPVAGAKLRPRLEIREVGTALAGDGEAKLRMVETQEPAFFVGAVVLKSTRDAAPFGRLVHAYPGFDTERPRGQIREVEVVGHVDTVLLLGVAVEQERVGSASIERNRPHDLRREFADVRLDDAVLDLLRANAIDAAAHCPGLGQAK